MNVLEYRLIDSRAAKEFMIKKLALSGLKPSDVDCAPAEHPQRKGMAAFVINYGDGYWRMRFDVPPDYPYGKYRGPSGVMPSIYYPVKVARPQFRKATIKYVCEGELKAAAMAKHFGIPVVGIGGCSMWAHTYNGMRILHPQLQEGIKPGDQIIYIGDRDILDRNKIDIARQAKAFCMRVRQLNCTFQTLLPPDPYKGVDDWLVAEKPSSLDDLEELDLDGYDWFPISLLKETGLKFKLNKDGEVVSYKQAEPTHSNTMIFAENLFTHNKPVKLDKYAGYLVDGQMSDASRALGTMIRILTDTFPAFKYAHTGMTHYFSDYCNTTGKSNAIADYVAYLQWDKVKRLDSWITKSMQFHSDMDITYAERVGRALIAAMYARIMEPGCQQDFMFILVGDQGIGKSTFFRTLGTFPEYNGYRTMTVSQLTKMDYTVGLMLKQAIILDIDDLDDMRRKDQGELKTFISRTHDEWREVYTTRTVIEPRGFVMTGSTNNQNMLSDLTGNRRYLVMSVRDIRGTKGAWAWSAELRDQLLAECHARWAELKDNWWDIPIAEINLNNMRHMSSDPVIDAIVEMLDNDKVLSHPKLGLVITSTAVHKWMDDARITEHSVGVRMNKLAQSGSLPFSLGLRVQARSADFLDNADDERRLLYSPGHKMARVWVRTIQKRR